MSVSPSRIAQILPSDKFVCSFPRSGNTWVRLLIARAIAYEHGFDDPYDLSVDLVVPDLHMEDVPLEQPERAQYLGDLRIVKCHEPALCIDNPMVYILRRPEDVLTSLFFHAQTFPKQRKPVLAEGIDKYALARRRVWEANVGCVRDHMAAGTIFLLTYEQLLEDTSGQFARIAAFLGLSVGDDAIQNSVALNNFSELQKRNDPKRPMFRAGVRGDSKNHMKPETIAEIDRTSGALYEELARQAVSAP